jgi:N-acetylneuraminate synthase
MFYIFEMANNHQGSLEHAKTIVDEFSTLAKETGISAAIKLQFRQLDTFIHEDFKNSDLKFVKRFNSTRLSKDNFSEIVQYIKDSGLIPVATPFDNESLSWFDDMDIPVVKIASCSIDDWPLLREVSKINKKIIISTAGADFRTLKKVYKLFKSNNRNFAFMHCVGEYPTPVENSNLKRINALMSEFPDIEIGFSTHESPNQKSMSPFAAAMGCTILEKHVGVETETIELNKYSNTASQMRDTIHEVQQVEAAMLGESLEERGSLLKLKRGVYFNKSLKAGTLITEGDIYYAMPVQEGQFNASSIDDILNKKITQSVVKNSPLMKNIIVDKNSKIIDRIKLGVNEILSTAKIPLSGEEKVQISCHYGLGKFDKCGAVIIDKINREYCKKLIVMFPNQSHPDHNHIRKEEAFELLHGDCLLILNGKSINLEKGKPILIPRGVKHSFSTQSGCVIEEVSTTHHIGDSIYADVEINTLRLEERKINIKLV